MELESALVHAPHAYRQLKYSLGKTLKSKDYWVNTTTSTLFFSGVQTFNEMVLHDIPFEEWTKIRAIGIPVAMVINHQGN